MKANQESTATQKCEPERRLTDQNATTNPGDTVAPASEAVNPDWQRCYVVPVRQTIRYNDPPGPVDYDGEVAWMDGRPYSVPSIKIGAWYAHAKFFQRIYYGLHRHRYSLWDMIDGPWAGVTTLLWDTPLGKITRDDYILELDGLGWAHQAWPTTGPVEVTPENDLEYICSGCGAKLGAGGEVERLPANVCCQSCEAALDALEAAAASKRFAAVTASSGDQEDVV